MRISCGSKAFSRATTRTVSACAALESASAAANASPSSMPTRLMMCTRVFRAEVLDRFPHCPCGPPVRVRDHEKARHSRIRMVLHVAVIHPRARSDVLTGDDLEAEGVRGPDRLVVYDLHILVDRRGNSRAVVGPPVPVEVKSMDIVAVADHDELHSLTQSCPERRGTRRL